MKKQTTKKAITSNFATVVKISYCGIQHLLKHQQPIAYTAGTYGWNADIYNIEGIAICTGYRSFGNIAPSYELCQKYDKMAREIRGKYLPYEEDKKQINALLADFLSEVLG